MNLVRLLTKWNNKESLSERAPFPSPTHRLTSLKDPQTLFPDPKNHKPLGQPHLLPKYPLKESNPSRKIGGGVFIVKDLDTLRPNVLTRGWLPWPNTKPLEEFVEEEEEEKEVYLNDYVEEVEEGPDEG